MLELVAGKSHLVIDPQGAWVTEWSHDGRPVLYSRRELTTASGETKTRGGMHVCLPNFGPGGDSGLAQHGFGRTTEWAVTLSERSRIVLQLSCNNEISYAGCVCTLTYGLGDGLLSATLHVANNGTLPARFAPAFHPYFALSDGTPAVRVNTGFYDLMSLEDTVFIEENDVTLTTTNGSIHVAQQQLSTWALWTDQLGNYVCVEPTYGGNRFLHPAQPDELLAPGEEREWGMRIGRSEERET